MKKYLLLTAILLPLCFLSYAQDFSNKGKDFWVAYGYHAIMNGTNSQDMVLYFATDQVTNITITIPGTGYTQTLTSGAAPMVLTSSPIPKNGVGDVRLLTESTSPENKGIHITADRPIVAYAHIYNANVSGASILFPTNTLGKDYYSINFDNVSNTTDANCWFYVVATDTGTTTVEITPSANTLTHPAGVPFTVTMTQGQVYNMMGELTSFNNPFTGVDLTGSKIRSISTGTSNCKRIAVFSGSGRISITCNGNSSSSDNYMVQAFPKSAWGKKYLTAHTGTTTPLSLINNYFRICVSDPATVVTVDGAPVTVPLINNFYYQIAATSNPLKIEADQPICVAQYITSQGACSNGNLGDPEVIYLSPVEQNISKVIWNATPNFNIQQHYYNVVIPNTGTAISSFKLDGVAVSPALFTVHPQDANFSYLISTVTAGQHRIESDSGFNAIAYGFGSAESYGYNAGTNIRDLYNFLSPINPLSIVPDPVACTGSPFFLSVTLPFQPTSLFWNFYGAQPNVTISNPASINDSTYLIGNKRVWRYKLPGLYTFNTANFSPGYNITITAGTTDAEGCGGTYERDFNLAVYDPPTAQFSVTNTGCLRDSVRFTDITNYVTGTYSYKWYWDFGDGHIDSVHNPAHLYTSPGNYTVKFVLVSNVGCMSDTARLPVSISALPTANITGATTVCQNSTQPNISFTAPTGSSPFTFEYNINGGPVLTATTTGTSNTVNVPVPTTTVGTYTYTLTQVTGNSCVNAQSGNTTVVVNPLPNATITGTTSVCQNATSPTLTFNVNSTTTGPYTFTYNINNGPDQTVSTTGSSTSASITAPTGTTGTFTYNLTAVTDGSPSACRRTLTGVSAVVTVNPLPTATISGTTAVCRNSTSPQITFTGANGTAPYTFTYNINSGANLTVTTTSGNSVTVNAPTGTAGTYTYNLVSVQDGSSTACQQAQSGSAVVTVYELPTADFTYTSPLCEIKQVDFLDQSTPNSGILNAWSWTFGDPPSGAANSSTLQNPSHTFNSAINYTVTLTVKNDKGCVSAPQSQVLAINPRPNAGFINPEVCLSDTYAQFIDTSSIASGSITQWNWTFGDPGSGPLNTSTIFNPQHSYSTIGTKDVVYIVTSAAGCKDTLYQSFFVNGDIPTSGFQVLTPNSLCANDSVQIKNTSIVNVGSIVKVKIFWDFAGAPGTFELDDNPVPGKVYAHLYPNFQTPPFKTYQIKFVAYSGETCIDTATNTVTIYAAPRVLFNPIPDTCLNIQPFQITQASEVGGVPGTFVFSGPGVSSTGIFDPSLVGPGLYSIHYVYTSVAGCQDSADRTIRILQPPVANFGYSIPTCETKQVTFTDSSSVPAAVGPIRVWTWDFDDGTPILVRNTNTAFTHVFAAAGVYRVKLYVTTAGGCNSIVKEKIVTVNPQPFVNFSFTDTACLPNARIQFRNLSTIADGTQALFRYSWTFGDPASGINNSSVAFEPAHIYTGTGPYPVKLTVTSNNGCVHDTTRLVNTIHPQPDADFRFSKPSVCIGDVVRLIDNSNPADGSLYQWYWDFGDNTQSNLQNPEHTYADTGDYDITYYMINSFGCNSDTIQKPFTVYPFPVVDAGPDKTLLEGYNVLLSATASGKDLEYVWTRDNNISTNLYLDNNRILRPTSSAIDDILYTLTVTARGGCPISDQVWVRVLKAPRIPNTFTPNGDGINDRWEIKYLKDYPNARVQVFTRNGQLVFEAVNGYTRPWDGTMKGKPLPFDTYYYVIEPESGRAPVTGYVTIVK